MMANTTNRKQNNLVYEEDIEAAVQLAISLLGKQGRMVWPTEGNLPNVKIFNPGYGTIWYGDLDANEIERVKRLQDKLEIPLTIESM